ncbi:MAG: hypothetical protein D6780_04125 [Candidatus Dadabacteria bacterium]|nr:MAG: hypothetical protein D6780_04125 [Candidatus Dadabacteria bacterium]
MFLIRCSSYQPLYIQLKPSRLSYTEREKLALFLENKSRKCKAFKLLLRAEVAKSRRKRGIGYRYALLKSGLNYKVEVYPLIGAYSLGTVVVKGDLIEGVDKVKKRRFKGRTFNFLPAGKTLFTVSSFKYLINFLNNCLSKDFIRLAQFFKSNKGYLIKNKSAEVLIERARENSDINIKEARFYDEEGALLSILKKADKNFLLFFPKLRVKVMLRVLYKKEVEKINSKVFSLGR